jgi:hypothetical protein
MIIDHKLLDYEKDFFTIIYLAVDYHVLFAGKETDIDGISKRSILYKPRILDDI